MGSPLPDDQRQLARALGADHPLPCLPPGRPPRDLHHQLDRSAAPPDPQDHQDPRALPTQDAARKLIYLAITKAETRWQRVLHWPSALAAFKIEFGDRTPATEI